jgi:hypothetical protein
MLLRASSKALGEDAKLDGAVGVGDGAVPHGAALIAYAELATRGGDGLAPARDALRMAVGDEGLVRAAATVGIFNGLVRVADSIGIPLDEGTRAASGSFRERLGLNAFSGASHADLASSEDAPRGARVEDLFGR